MLFRAPEAFRKLPGARGVIFPKYALVAHFMLEITYIFLTFFDFLFFYRVFRAPEAYRRLPGARGVIFPKYEPVASHGDPIHARNDLNFVSTLCLRSHMLCNYLSFSYFGRVL